jgi:Zn-dependent protease with chaperone function
MGKLFFASLFTLTVLSSFVFGIVFLILVYTEKIDIVSAVALTVGINFILWLIGPSITDVINRWFYKVKFLSKEELAQQYPEVFQIIEQVSAQYKFKFPKIGIIPDKNPTAFTYGSGRFNARIILTEGIFHFLNPQEVRAVVAHELGHVVNRDFIVMMIVSTLVQILYEIYVSLIHARGKKSEGAKLIAVFVYFLYIIGIYILYYLSRTREYLADAFSAKVTDPRDLSNALIKIAYGIVTAEDDDKAKKLLESTRHLGIIDVKNAKHYGITSYITHNDPNVLSEVMVFDKISPWAKLAELNSTHPLIGNRIDHLSDISKTQGRQFFFDIDSAIERLKVNKAKLLGSFFFGLFILLLPYLFAIYALFFLPFPLIPAAFAFGLILQIPYKFPLSRPVETTVLEQMRNPYASPIRGKPVALSGKVIGRGVPGFIFGEDMMYQDSTGLVFLNYSSAFGFIGNIIFALKKIKTLFNVPSRAVGWFYRGIGSMISLKYIQTEKEKVRSHPILWSLFLPLILIIVSFCWYFLLYTPGGYVPNIFDVF